MVDNVVWTDSWPSIAVVGCGLVCVVVGEEQARKVLALRGLQERGTSRLGSRDPVADGIKSGRMVQEEQDDVVVKPVRAVSLIETYWLAIKPKPVQGDDQVIEWDKFE